MRAGLGRRGGPMGAAGLGAALLSLALATGAGTPEISPVPIEGVIVSLANRHTPEGGQVLLLTAPAAEQPPAPLEYLRTRGQDHVGGMAVGMGGDGLTMDVIDSRFRPGSRWTAGRPTRLLRIDPDGRQQVLRDDLPADAMALEAIDLDGDGEQEILLAAPGRLIRLALDGTRRDALLIESPGIDPNGGLPRTGTARSRAIDGGGLWIDEGDALAIFARSENGSPWRRRHRVSLPADAIYRKGEILIFHPHPQVIRNEHGKPVAVSIFSASGRTQRAPWHLLALDGSRKPRLEQTWLAFAGPKMLIGSQTLLLGGRPAIVVTTLTSDRVRFDPPAQLSLFTFEANRSRAGLKPTLSIEGLDSDEAHSARAHALDVDGDGSDDLVIGFAAGKRFELRIYLGDGRGAVAPRPLRRRLKVDARAPIGSVRFVRDARGRWTHTLLRSPEREWVCPPAGREIVDLDHCRTRPAPDPDGHIARSDTPSHWSSHWSGVVDLEADRPPARLTVITGSGPDSQVIWTR